MTPESYDRTRTEGPKSACPSNAFGPDLGLYLQHEAHPHRRRAAAGRQPRDSPMQRSKAASPYQNL